jgi:hypothetical protein
MKSEKSEEIKLLKEIVSKQKEQINFMAFESQCIKKILTEFIGLNRQIQDIRNENSKNKLFGEENNGNTGN